MGLGMGIWLKPSELGTIKTSPGTFVQVTEKETHILPLDLKLQRDIPIWRDSLLDKVVWRYIRFFQDHLNPRSSCTWSHTQCSACGLLRLILKYYQHSLIVASHIGNEDSILRLVLLSKQKEELLTFILLYLITNYRCRHGVENCVSSTGWVKHLQGLRPIFWPFHAFFLRAERNQVVRQTPVQVKPVDAWVSCPGMW